jgi:hypothetical protein
MDTVLFEEEDMALRKEDKIWIASEIRTAIQEHLNPHGWRKLREWIPLASILTIMVAMLALAGAGWNYAFSRVDKEARFEEKTDDRLSKIEKTLDHIQGVQDLNVINGLDPLTFAKSLPALRKIVQKPASEMKPPEELLRSIADKLRNINPDSEEYWPTVLQFLNFASAQLESDVPPPGKPNIVIEKNAGYIPLGTIKRAVVLLDGGELGSSRFENSRIIFTNNPVKFRDVVFINCSFQMPTENNPNDYLRKTGRVLLASDLQSVSFPSD